MTEEKKTIGQKRFRDTARDMAIRLIKLLGAGVVTYYTANNLVPYLANSPLVHSLPSIMCQMPTVSGFEAQTNYM